MDWIHMLTSEGVVEAAGVFAAAVLWELRRRMKARAEERAALRIVPAAVPMLVAAVVPDIDRRVEIALDRFERAHAAELRWLREKVKEHDGFDRGIAAAGGTGPHHLLTDGRAVNADRKLDELLRRLDRLEREREPDAPEYLEDNDTAPHEPSQPTPRRRR